MSSSVFQNTAAELAATSSTRGVLDSRRVAWVDFAKGICIFLVVMLHTTHYVEDNRFYVTGWLDHFVEFAKPFRMPDFFLLSGLFLARVIDRPWVRFLDTKVVHFFYFYFLWMPIIFLLFTVRQAGENGWVGAENLPKMFLLEFIDPSFPLWFIHSLPLYFLITRLLKKVPWWLVFGGAAFLQSAGVHTGWTVIDQFCLRFVYFYSGYVFSEQVFRIADYAMSKPAFTTAYIVLWAMMESYAVNVGLSVTPGMSLLLGYLGALAVICFSCLLCVSGSALWLRYMGQNSIVVYLAFMVPMAFFERLIRWKVSDVGTACLMVTVASVITCVLLFRVTRNSPLSFLFTRPEWAKLKIQVQRSVVRASG